MAAAWRRAGTCDLWRRHSDAVNAALLARWLPADPVGVLLKTDLFDEALTGGLQPLLEARARRFVAIDLAVPVAAAARSRLPTLRGACADVRRLPFGDGAFDVVVSISTLDHFPTVREIGRALNEIARVLRPGGALMVTLDNLANPAVAVRNHLPSRFLRRLGIVPYPVGASCGPRRLRELLAAAGFEVRELTAVLHCPRATAVAAAGLLQRGGRTATQRRFARWLMAFEALSRSPGRFLTGHYVAARAVKRDANRSAAAP